MVQSPCHGVGPFWLSSLLVGVNGILSHYPIISGIDYFIPAGGQRLERSKDFNWEYGGRAQGFTL
jgi:hypothetical protein